MWLDRDPKPQRGLINREGIKIVLNRFIHERISLGNIYRLVASYDPLHARRTMINNDEWSWTLFRVRGSKKDDEWWYDPSAEDLGLESDFVMGEGKSFLEQYGLSANGQPKRSWQWEMSVDVKYNQCRQVV